MMKDRPTLKDHATQRSLAGGNCVAMVIREGWQ